MKNNLLLIIFVMCNTHHLFAQYYTQYFDGADTIPYQSLAIVLDTSADNIWQIGTPNKSIFNAAATLPNALVTDTANYYPNNNTSSFVLPVPIAWSWGVLAVQWKQKLDLDAGTDGGIIEIYNLQTQTWQNVFNNPYIYNFYGYDTANADTLNTGEYAFSGTDTTWRDIWLCADMTWLSQQGIDIDTAYFRFTLKTDAINNRKDGWLIDNMFAHLTMIHTAANTTQKEYIKVYPNPTKDILHIEIQKLQEFHIIENMVLTNAQGQLLDEWKNIPTKFFINTQKYHNGLYYLKIQTNKKTETIPIIINHN